MNDDEEVVETPSQLFQVVPREQAGSVTGARYDFQYHQAAADALQVLDDTQVACVYCEWHDDYVLEAAGVVSYRFHQVKTRSASQGPWKINEFFGVSTPRGKKKAADEPAKPAAIDSIFARFLNHVERFGERCELFVFVTDAGIATDFEQLLQAVSSTVAVGELDEKQRKNVERLYESLRITFSWLTQNSFLLFLKRLRIQTAMGSLGRVQDCRALIGGRILQLSEVDLTQSQSQKIGAELVAAVRDRSHRVLPTLPESLEALRAAKGLVIEDILGILSLSAAGYRELKAGGRDAVVALSRLHRLLAKSELPPTEIPHLCRLKAAWDAWWVVQRHVLKDLDMIALRGECARALTVHADGSLDFNGLRKEAEAISAKFASVLTPTEPLNDELVFGLMLSMVVEAEP